MTSVTNLQTLNPIWQRLSAALNCNLSFRQSPLSCILSQLPEASCYPGSWMLWILPTHSTRNLYAYQHHEFHPTLRHYIAKHSTSQASFTFGLKCFFIEMYLVQMASHKTVGEIIYFKIFHQGKLTKMTQFIYKAIPRQNMLLEKSSK